MNTTIFFGVITSVDKILTAAREEMKNATLTSGHGFAASQLQASEEAEVTPHL